MSNLTNETSSPIPLIYADQISGLRPGVYTSKIEFALENPSGEGLTQTAVVVVPTANLVGFAHRVLAQFSEEQLLALIAKRTEEFINGAENPALAIETLKKRVEKFKPMEAPKALIEQKPATKRAKKK